MPEPGADQMWVRALDDAADGPDIHVDAKGNRWRRVEWHPGQPRDGLWDMGHISKGVIHGVDCGCMSLGFLGWRRGG